MQKPYIYNQFFFYLFIVFTSACNTLDSSSSGKNPVRPTSETNQRNTPVIPPRIDSVLQFNSLITSIFEDSRGNIWFGSWCDGLCRYDPKATVKKGKEKFFYYTVENGIPGAEILTFNGRQVPKGNAVGSIQEDKNGNIVFATLAGFVRISAESIVADRPKFTLIHPEKKSKPLMESIDYSKEDSTLAWNRELDHLWFGDSQDKGVFRYDGHKLQNFTFPIVESIAIGERSRLATYSQYKDRNGNIWFGTEGGGIMRYNGSLALVEKPAFACINQHEEKGIVRCIFQDISGKVWISNVLMGLYVYDHEAYLNGKESLKNFTKEKGYYTLSEIRSDSSLDPFKMLDGIQTIAEDNKGHLWFGSYDDGLWRYDGQELTHFTKENGLLPSNTIKTIFKDSKGMLWFGIGKNNAHVYHYNGTSFDRCDL